MDVQYVYTKKRTDFGRQCFFSDRGPELLDDSPTNRTLFDRYILKNPVQKYTQCDRSQAEHEVNTVRAEFQNRAMNHTEGGWPKDVNCADVEQTVRFRRKIEKDENYIHTVMHLAHNMEHYILQNNSVNIYQQYYSDVEPTPMVERCQARTVNVFRDPGSGPSRSINRLSWSPDGSRIAVSHCNLVFQAPQFSETCTHSYIWEIENPNRPEITLKPITPITCLEYNSKDPNSMISGMFSGQVAFWDIRRGSNPVEMCPVDHSHRDPVSSVLWINSKSGAEFFSTSTDGVCKWWDMRKLSVPTDMLLLDPSKQEEGVMANCLGASCLEYEATVPTKFMVGTEQGLVLLGNRKGKSRPEKIPAKFPAHLGPIYTVQRSSTFVKNFLTIGDWTARIWSEDCRESSIIWTGYHKAMLYDGCWSPTRYSVVFVARSDGILDVWDILVEQHTPVLSVKVTDFALRCLRPHEEGRLVACANMEGSTYLVEFSENLASSLKNDKVLMTAMLEREGRREKILEAKSRELRLKMKTRPTVAASDLQMDDEDKGPRDARAEQLNLDQLSIQYEKEFFDAIEKELRPPPPEDEEKPPTPPPEPEPVQEPIPPPPPPPSTIESTKKKGKGKGKGKGKKK